MAKRKTPMKALLLDNVQIYEPKMVQTGGSRRTCENTGFKPHPRSEFLLLKF